MDNDLDRSVRLLEDALSTTERGLFKKNINNSLSRLGQSLMLSPSEQKRLLMNERLSMYDATINSVLYENSTVTGSVLLANNPPWATTLNNLYREFFEILQTHSGKLLILYIIFILHKNYCKSLYNFN